MQGLALSVISTLYYLHFDLIRLMSRDRQRYGNSLYLFGNVDFIRGFLIHKAGKRDRRYYPLHAVSQARAYRPGTTDDRKTRDSATPVFRNDDLRPASSCTYLFQHRQSP